MNSRNIAVHSEMACISFEPLVSDHTEFERAQFPKIPDHVAYITWNHG